MHSTDKIWTSKSNEPLQTAFAFELVGGTTCEPDKFATNFCWAKIEIEKTKNSEKTNTTRVKFLFINFVNTEIDCFNHTQNAKDLLHSQKLCIDKIFRECFSNLFVRLSMHQELPNIFKTNLKTEGEN